jgi:tRNA A-37 threonylcarbamoyl transferase component Bud32
MTDDSTLTDNIDGKYRIEHRLGGGGMGEVFRARHLLLNQLRALKKIRPEYSGDAEYKKRFLREAKAAGLVNHPNLCSVYDLVDHERDGLFMVMEYIDGESLGEKLRKKGSYSPEQSIELLEPIAEALDTAHAAGVIHRDVKPSNIMVGTSPGRRPLIKLLDLGIAKLRPRPGEKPETALTRLGQMLGTIPYISPEQLSIPQRDGKLDQDGNIEIDGRADVYSLGVVFYELIAGRRPFQANHASTLIHQIRDMIPKPLHERNSHVPVAFDEAIRKALSVDRADRQQTCGELISDLKRALGLTERGSRWRRLVWLLIPLTLLLMALFMWLGCLWCTRHPVLPCPTGTPTPTPTPIFEGGPVETEKGTFRIVVFNEGYNWKKESDSVVQRSGVDLVDGLTSELSGGDFQAAMGNASDLVCLGTASVEAALGVGEEERRAGRRANRLAAWLSGTGKFTKSIFTLNLGKFMGEESSPQTESQRRIVIVGVIDKKSDTKITGEDVRDAIRKYQRERGQFPIAFDNYSLTQSGKPLSLAPFVPK